MFVVQFSVPSLLSVWIQCAGRAGRSRDMQATATLLVERSITELLTRWMDGKDLIHVNQNWPDVQCNAGSVLVLPFTQMLRCGYLDGRVSRGRHGWWMQSAPCWWLWGWLEVERCIAIEFITGIHRDVRSVSEIWRLIVMLVTQSPLVTPKVTRRSGWHMSCWCAHSAHIGQSPPVQRVARLKISSSSAAMCCLSWAEAKSTRLIVLGLVHSIHQIKSERQKKGLCNESCSTRVWDVVKPQAFDWRLSLLPFSVQTVSVAFDFWS